MPDAPHAHEHCDQCGFDGGRYDGASAPRRDSGARAAAGKHCSQPPATDLRVRPAPETWSALEYAAHSRDITALHVFGVEQALTGNEPQFAAIDPDLADTAATNYNVRVRRCRSSTRSTPNARRLAERRR